MLTRLKQHVAELVYAFGEFAEYWILLWRVQLNYETLGVLPFQNALSESHHRSLHVTHVQRHCDLFDVAESIAMGRTWAYMRSTQLIVIQPKV